MTKETWRVESVYHLLDEDGAVVKRFIKSERQQYAPPEKGYQYGITTPSNIGPTKGKVVEVEKCAQGYPLFARIRVQIATYRSSIDDMVDWLIKKVGLQEISEEEEKNLGKL